MKPFNYQWRGHRTVAIRQWMFRPSLAARAFPLGVCAAVWKKPSWRACACLVYAWLTFAASAREVKLAILPVDPAVKSAADLLTPALSQNPSIHLLERSEIDRIVNEQRLAQTQTKDFIKIGQLLGADGLLILETVTTGTNTALAQRLVAVQAGVVLDSTQYPWPLPDLAAWPNRVVARVTPALPKLEVPRDGAIALSLLQLRSSLKSAAGEAAERELTYLMRLRLTQQPELFVLERQQLDRLTEEKNFNGVDESAFWNGSYLLEGTIDRDGYIPDTMTLDLTLSPPGAGVKISIVARGKRDNSTAIVEEATSKILQAMKRQAAAAPWRPRDEALRFLEEAQWALRWGMAREAVAASEAGWALGIHSKDAAVLRIRSYMIAAQAPPSVNHFGIYYLRPDALWIFEQPPAPEALPAATRALELYCEATRAFPPGDELAAARDWYDLGSDALDTASHVLFEYYYGAEMRKGREDALTALRARARETAELILARPQVKTTFWERPVTRTSFYRPRNIHQITLAGAYLWYEQTRPVLDLYRAYYESPFVEKLHEQLYEERVSSSRLPCWTESARAAAPSIWRGFLNEIASSTNPLIRLEGKLLQMADLKANGDQLVRQVQELSDLLWETRIATFTRDNGDTFYQAATAIEHKVSGEGNPHKEIIRSKLLPELRRKTEVARKEFQQVASALRDDAKKRDVTARKELLRQHLLTATNYIDRVFTSVSASDFSDAEALEFVPLLQQYRARLGRQTWANHLEIILGARTNRVSGPGLKLEAKSGPPIATTNSIVSNLSRPMPTSQATNRITATRFWAAAARMPALPPVMSPYQSPNRPAPPPPAITVGAPLFRENRLWLLSAPGGFNSSRFESRVARVDLDTFETESISIDAGEADFKRGMGIGHSIEILGDDLFVTWPGRIKRYHLPTKKWTEYPLTTDEDPALYVINNHLYLSSRSSIVEFDPRTASTRVLASSRRRPAQNLLDKLDSLNSPILFGGPKQTLQAFIMGTVYAGDLATDAWTAIASMATNIYATGFNARGVSTTLGTGGLIVHEQIPYGWNRLWLAGHETTPLVALATPANPARPTGGGPSTRWLAPAPGGLVNGGADLDDGNLWIVSGPIINNSFSSKLPDPTPTNVLWYFDHRMDRGIPFLLEHRSDNPAHVAEFFRVKHDAFEYPQEKLLATPKGLVFFKIPGPGFWFVPKAGYADFIESKVAPIAAQNARLLAKYDANHDGNLDAAETDRMRKDPEYLRAQWKQTVTEWLNEFDLNNDGRIDATEYRALYAAERGPSAAPPFGPFLALRSPSALAAEAAEAFARHDLNHDGALTPDELEASLDPDFSRPLSTSEQTVLERLKRMRSQETQAPGQAPKTTEPKK